MIAITPPQGRLAASLLASLGSFTDFGFLGLFIGRTLIAIVFNFLAGHRLRSSC
jgi:hypothetical protein